MQDCFDYSYLGFGLGLRETHYSDLINLANQEIDWLEIVSENFIHAGGRHKYFLHMLKERYPMVMHGVGMNLGSKDPVNYQYLDMLKQLISEISPKWISDHLSWTGIHGINTHDLLPLPYTEEVIDHVSAKIKQVQNYLGTKILLENPSSYINFAESTLSEWQVLSKIAEQADCLILLDINNIYVSSVNHNFSAVEYIEYLPIDRVQQIHLAGHQYYAQNAEYPEHIIDTHDHQISNAVWDLYAIAVRRFGRVSTMIERDQYIPPLADLIQELTQAKQIFAANLQQTAALVEA